MFDHYIDHESCSSITNSLMMASMNNCLKISILRPLEGSLINADISNIFMLSKLTSLSLMECNIDDEFVKSKFANIQNCVELKAVEMGNL